MYVDIASHTHTHTRAWNATLDLMGGVSTYFAGFLGGKESVQMLMHFTIPLMMT